MHAFDSVEEWTNTLPFGARRASVMKETVLPRPTLTWWTTEEGNDGGRSTGEIEMKCVIFKS